MSIDVLITDFLKSDFNEGLLLRSIRINLIYYWLSLFALLNYKNKIIMFIFIKFI